MNSLKQDKFLSVLGFKWQQKSFDERLALAIQQKFDLSSTLAQIISSSNIGLGEVENFLNPTIKANLPNPSDLLDMDIAVAHLVSAILQKKKITIFADYDVDGATSSALLKRFLDEVSVDVNIYVPDRINEGYGPNTEALLKLKKKGTDLLITVDCGTVAFAPLEEAARAGLEVIVIDHHIGVVEKPQALAVINPNRIDESFLHKNICAATVSFLFVVAVNKKLREINYYQENKINEPNLMYLLDLVALGTVCDVMPLTGLNRALVTQGLKILKLRKNIGIRALCDVANLDEEPSAYHLGFILGPRINAGGRVGKSDLGARILSSNDSILVKDIALQLNNLNNERKDIETSVLAQATANLENNYNGFSANDEVIFAVGDGWHQGVIGIVASRLKDLYGKPVAVIALEGSKGKASCRSIHGVDFGKIILEARLNGLLIEGGGHAMAGGFSIAKENILSLHKFFQEKLSKRVKEINAQKIKEFHVELDLENINIDLIKQLQSLEPYGSGNYRPKFIIRNLRLLNAKLIGKNQEHVSCNFSSLSNIGFVQKLQAVAFRATNNAIGEILLSNKLKQFSIACELNINSWMGAEKVQATIEDIIISSS